MDYHINDSDKKEKALLISVDTGEHDAEVSMAELAELADTAGATVEGSLIQKRPSVEAATYVGKGRLEEITEFVQNNDIDVIIADDELTPVQVRNIEDKTDVKVIDRTTLILDIFANRAISKEGKLQVELAQLQYRLTRLSGQGTSLSRLGGGIGTRGPGETKLETDRRHIRRRITALKEELDVVEKRRNALHERRKKNRAIAVAIVGYTNAGKSTLMNYLTGAGVLEEDKLFATLDPTARKLVLPDGNQIMLIDTVGLVRRLPHQLVDAFRSTLEEAVWADIILNVCDASSEECSEHIKVTLDLLESLECGDKTVINVLNKCDLAPDVTHFPLIGNSVCISAKTGEGIEKLLKKITEELAKTRMELKVLIPFDKGAMVGEIRNNGKVITEEFTDKGTVITFIAESSFASKVKDYII